MGFEELAAHLEAQKAKEGEEKKPNDSEQPQLETPIQVEQVDKDKLADEQVEKLNELAGKIQEELKYLEDTPFDQIENAETKLVVLIAHRKELLAVFPRVLRDGAAAHGDEAGQDFLGQMFKRRDVPKMNIAIDRLARKSNGEPDRQSATDEFGTETLFSADDTESIMRVGSEWTELEKERFNDEDWEELGAYMELKAFSKLEYEMFDMQHKLTPEAAKMIEDFRDKQIEKITQDEKDQEELKKRTPDLSVERKYHRQIPDIKVLTGINWLLHK